MAGDAHGADESPHARKGAGGRAPAKPHTPPDAGEARPCMPCRGTGTVISNLGGTRSEVPCPFCRGTGVRQAGVDAQEAWRERQGVASSAAETDAGEQA
jgi:DnaJ-class molecular chaperone